MAEQHFRLPVLAPLLYGADAANRAPIMLFDVGCSGGIEDHWLHFGKALHAVGFDPLISEVDRLNADAGRNPNVRYEAAFVGCTAYDELFPATLRDNRIASRSNESFRRTSAAAHAQLKNIDYIKDNFNRGDRVVLATSRIQLDDYAAEHGIARVDLLKVDTDGHDIEVLLGAKNLLKGALAVKIEAQFHGAVHPCANTFSNIDGLLRQAGFTLFGLDAFRYTRAALPGVFANDIAAQTIDGSMQWGEAIYVRDLADPDYERKHPFVIAGEDVIKLSVFLDIFGMPDCAAELLLERRALIERPGGHSVEQLLDAITPGSLGPGHSYASYIAKFRDDPSALFPSRLPADTPIAPTSSGDEIASALAAAEAARQELAALKRSTSWRLTAPLRRLADFARKGR